MCVVSCSLTSASHSLRPTTPGSDIGAWKRKLLSLGSWNFAPFPALFLPPALVTPPKEALICENISLAQPVTGAQNQQSLGPGTISCFRMTKGKWRARWWWGARGAALPWVREARGGSLHWRTAELLPSLWTPTLGGLILPSSCQVGGFGKQRFLTQGQDLCFVAHKGVEVTRGGHKSPSETFSCLLRA